MGEAVKSIQTDNQKGLPIPNGWIRRRLTDVIAPRGEKVNPADLPDKPFIGMNHVEAHTTRIIGFIPAREMKSSAARFYKDDVLYGRLRPYLNKVAQPKNDGLASAEFIVFPQNKIIESAFLKYRFITRDFVNFANHLNEGDRPRVNFEQIGDFDLLLPPFAEQQRIVDKIEELFSELDKGVENLRTAQQQLKVYRQALLKHAFEGKLTADWRAQNPDKLESADALLARIQQERETRYQQQLQDWTTAQTAWESSDKTDRKPNKPKAPKVLPPLTAMELAELSKLPFGWAWTQLELLITSIDQGWSPKCENNRVTSDEWGVIKTTAIQHGSFIESQNKILPINMKQKLQHKLESGDILITRAGPRVRVGVCCLIRKISSNLMNCDKAYRIRSLEPVCSAEYLEGVLNSPRILDELENIKSGISDSGVNLNQGAFLRLTIPYCSHNEQAALLGEIEQKLSVLDQLEATITHSLQQADALRQSILKKAFAGQLVPQHHVEEPASVLLARIQAERANHAKTTAKIAQTAKPRTRQAKAHLNQQVTSL